MLNPLYKVNNFWNKPLAICDSGAFQDIDRFSRLNPEDALDRQLKYEKYIQSIIGEDWRYEAYCIYDQMIGVDECIVDGKKKKVRGTRETAQLAVQDTLKSAAFYKTREQDLTRIVYIAQGVDPEQYLQCTDELLTMARQIDYFGFGGFCIIGRQRKIMLPLFYKTCDLVLPLLKSKGITRAHILGVCIPEAITYAVNKGKQYNVIISTDSSAPEVNGVAFGRGYDQNMRPSRKLGDKWIDYNPIYEAHRNVQLYTEWMNKL